MTILSGGAAFLGSHSIEQLSEAGKPVRRSSDTLLRTLAKVELVAGLVDDRASADRAVLAVSAVVVSFAQGVKQTVDWYRAAGRL